MKIPFPKLSRAEWALLCLLVTGLVLYFLSQEWSLREGARLSTGTALSLSRFALVDNVRILGAAILFPSYLILLITAERHRNASFVLKCLLIVPALSFAYMGLRSPGGPWLYNSLVFFALFLLPNRVLIRKRLFLILYSCLVNGLVAAMVVLTLCFTSQFSSGKMLPDYALAMVNICLILASACTLSSWLAYQRSVDYDGPGFGVTVYRWTFITLITVISGSFAVAATATFAKREKLEKLLEESGLDPSELMQQAIQYKDENLRNQVQEYSFESFTKVFEEVLGQPATTLDSGGMKSKLYTYSGSFGVISNKAAVLAKQMRLLETAADGSEGFGHAPESSMEVIDQITYNIPPDGTLSIMLAQSSVFTMLIIQEHGLYESRKEDQQQKAK